MAKYTKEIAALDQAIASGVLSVTVDGTTTRYGSFDDLTRRRAYLVRLQERGTRPSRPRNLLTPFNLRDIS